MDGITYDLKAGDYYDDIKEFAQEVVAKVEKDHSKIIKEYRDFIAAEEIEEVRDRKEYAFELLALGVLANLYLNDVLETSKPYYVFMQNLIKFKAQHSKLEKIIEWLQSFLNTVLLHSAHRDDYNYEFVNKDDLKELLQWLEATGEYKEEVLRFKYWERYFDNKFLVKVSYDLKAAMKLAEWFEEQAQEKLGHYTKNVKKFLKQEQSKHLWRQDILLRTKPEREYHLNMLGCQIMNQVCRPQFLVTNNKVILAPICMRAKNEAQCQAEETELGLQCTHCDRDCNINLIDSLGSQGEFKVLIIDHTHDFDDYFSQWQDQKHTGLIVIACALNLLLVNYKLQRFNIPGQALILDYCGCQLHWSEEGVTTDINLDELLATLRESPQDKFIQMSIFDN